MNNRGLDALVAEARSLGADCILIIMASVSFITWREAVARRARHVRSAGASGGEQGQAFADGMAEELIRMDWSSFIRISAR